MSARLDPVMFRQVSVIEQIIRDETWLEGERRRRPVSPDDPAVRDAVCRVILRIGAELRQRCGQELAGAVNGAT